MGEGWGEGTPPIHQTNLDRTLAGKAGVAPTKK